MGLFNDLFGGMDRETAEEYGELTKADSKSTTDVRRIREIEDTHSTGAVREARNRHGR